MASWMGIIGTEDLGLPQRLLPGGWAAGLVVNAWNGGVPLADSMTLLALTLAWVVVASGTRRRRPTGMLGIDR
ncbi:MAG: hypothetical protein ACRC35_08930 [Angustibacter sp.]